MEGGGRGENVSTEERKTEVAPQPQRGGARRNYTTEKEKKKSQSPVPQSEWKNTQNAPGPEGGGVGKTEKKRTRKTYSPVPQFSGPIPQAMARH